MKFLEIQPLETTVQNGQSIRRCRIQRVNDQSASTTKELWYQFDQSIPPPDESDCDSYLLALIMSAMKEGRDIWVRGQVSKQLLSNLVEFQAAWQKWAPEIYQCINIRVDTLREEAAPIPGAICAFSGGVDATFSVWRHVQELCSYRTQNIRLCSMVHGFDIPLNNEMAFQNAAQRAQLTLNDLALKLVPIKTNFRQVSGVNWEHVHGCALVAALGNLKRVASTCLIGSSGSYNSLAIPWGTSPITDHLLSSNDFVVIHDGASHSRIEKVETIAPWQVGIENLRVCWQGDLHDRNCGQCEKCMRTKLNFLVTGHQIPSCFPQSDVIADMRRIAPANEAIRARWQDIYDYAISHHRQDPWVAEIPKLIHRKSMVDRFFPKKSSRRRWLKSVVAKIR